jgi:predicted dienelactone hydrolase
MRLFEISLIVVIVTAAIAQMSKIAAWWSFSLTILGVLLGSWHVLREGTYWQMFPALVGLVALVIWQLSANRLQTALSLTTKTRLALVVVVLCVTSFGLLIFVPMFVLPKPTGPYPVGTRIIYMEDPRRTEDAEPRREVPRELMVQIWYPAEPSNNHLAAYQRRGETSLATSYRTVLWTNSRLDAPVSQKGSPFSVLLFNHGWAGRRTQNTFLTEELASHGYVVAAIDHTYNAVQVALPGDRIVDDTNGYDPLDPSKHSAAEIKATWNKELRKWVEDEVFVLNELQNENIDSKSFWYGRLNTERAGAFGHSFGGAAAIQVCSVDPRIQSALNMDGWTFGDIQHRAAKQPTMFMYAKTTPTGTKVQRPTTPESHTLDELNTSDENEVAASLKQFGGYKFYVSGTSHMDFTDNPLVNPWRRWGERDHISAAEIQSIVRSYVLAFFDETIRGERSNLLTSGSSSRFREVQVEHWVTPANDVSAGTYRNRAEAPVRYP